MPRGSIVGVKSERTVICRQGLSVALKFVQRVTQIEPSLAIAGIELRCVLEQGQSLGILVLRLERVALREEVSKALVWLRHNGYRSLSRRGQRQSTKHP